MPTKAKKRAPKASRKKVWVHTFYLLQPFVQFAALIAVMLILARCSPLAPSTDRNEALQVTRPSENGEMAAAAALEEEIQSSLAEVNTTQLEVIPESEMNRIASDAPHVDSPMQELDVKSVFPIVGKKRKNRKVMLLPLAPESQEALFRDGRVRIHLSERMKSQTKEKALRFLLQNLNASLANKEIGAAAYLVLPDATMQRVNGAFDSLSLTLKVSLSIPAEDRAYLEIQRMEDDPAHAQDNAALLAAALDEAGQLAILLE
jgi:hypothetical protein